MSRHPRFDEFIGLFSVRKQANNEISCICPAHADKQASLSITEGEKGILVYCHAGCSPADICAAVGWKEKDLFYSESKENYRRDHSNNHSNNNPKTLPPWEREVEAYPYHDADGNLIYEVVRLHSPKDFQQRRPDPANPKKRIWNMQGITPLPFRLPVVLKGIETDKYIFIVEGEKDVFALWNIGIIATCNSGGAGKWLDCLSPYFKGAHIILIPDNDVPGCKHMMDVACKLHQHAASIKYLNIPGLDPKGDISDYLKSHDAADFLKLAESAITWIPGTLIEPSDEAKAQYEKSQESKSRRTSKSIDVPSELPDGEFMLTDYGNAERLVHSHGANLRYNVNSGQWLHWDGVIWREDNDGLINRLAIGTIRAIYDEIAALYAKMRDCTPDERKSLNQRVEALQKHAVASESKARLSSMIDLAQTCEGIPVSLNELNADPWLLCCANSVIDLRNGELLSPRQDNLITKQIPVNYDANAQCPKWLKFLEDIQPDPNIRSYMQRAAGYTLTGDVSEQCLFFLFGGGRNGKSTFMEILTDLTGDYFQKARADTIMIKQNGGGIPNDIAMLAGARFVLVSELAAKQQLDESLVKDLTGGDSISARFLRQEYFTFRAGFKLWMYGNEKPRIREKSEGIWRRMRLIPFAVQIPKHKRDGRLKEKLRAELPGILNWAIQGCLDWQKHGLEEPEEITCAVDDYRREQDKLASFLESVCTMSPLVSSGVSSSPKVSKKDLFDAYKSWAERNCEQAYDTIRAFNNEIRSRPGIREDHGTGNVAIWKGIRLKNEEELAIDAMRALDTNKADYGNFIDPDDGVIWVNDD